MRAMRRLRRLVGSLSLTRQVALLSLLPMLALGFVLARVLQNQIVERTLADATRSARIIAHFGVQPKISPQAMRDGLSPADVSALDMQLSAPRVGEDLARIKVWNAKDEVIYSEDHSLIGQRLTPSDDLEAALAGHPEQAQLIDPSKDSETASEVGLGELIEVYVPLRFSAKGPPAGAFEIYLSYRPIAAAVAHDKRTIALLLVVGLALLWAILYRILVRASRRLRRQARENYRLARFDPLTELPNRMLFTEEVTKAARRAKRRGGAVAVLLIDLERFSAINNTLGASNGDQILCEVARRLENGFGEDVVTARVGGDEYALLCRQVGGIADAHAIARAVQARLEEPVLLDDVALDIEASIGMAVLGEHADDPAVLLQRADLALAHARSHGSRLEIYSPEYERSDAGALKLLGQVRGALAHGEFVLHYQPKVNIADRRVTGVEALVRWQHPEHGLLAPVRFVALIEQTALIGPLTQNVIEQALAQTAAWNRRGIRLSMSVNLSARNLLDPDLPARIAGQLKAHGVPAAQLIVEVTESSTMADPARGIRVLDALREMGIGISIDYFGTGNASIEYLADLPATELKIDRSFVTDILADERAQAIVRSTIDLARNLGLSVVGEGIETEETMECLSSLGCATGQGYLFSKPLPAQELTPRLIADFGLESEEPVLDGEPVRDGADVRTVAPIQS
jgi:diguanylate cyclase (GGDEF)-like protein